MIAALVALGVGTWLIHLGRKVSDLGNDTDDEPTTTSKIGRN